MDYSKLSDFEINKLVAAALNINVEETMAFRNGGEDINTHSSGLVLMKKITEHKKFWREFDPCNNPADAWPIIAANGISLNYDGISWESSCWRSDYRYDDWVNHPERPLRIAMILFLMMKDEGAKNGNL